MGSCSAASGYQTSTLSLSNSSGSTAYVTVEYSTDGGSSWTVHDDAEEADNLTITSGSSNTSLTVNVPHGSTITWRYKSSNASGDWTGLSYSTISASDTVDCVVDSLTVSQSLSACSGGSTTSTLSITNDETYTAYLVVEYSINGGSYVEHSSGEDSDDFSLAASGSDTTTFTQPLTDGQSIICLLYTSPSPRDV